MEQRVLKQNKADWLRRLMLLLFVVQPLLDVLSFWLNEAQLGNDATLLLRFAILFGTAALGFAYSAHRRVYIGLFIAAGLLAVGHVIACTAAGYDAPVQDLTNYIRVIQVPLFTLCFITFLRRTGEAGYHMMECGFAANFVIIIAVELLSAVTGTNPYTYPNKGIGLVGWFYFANSQSAVLCALIPVVLMLVIRRKRLLSAAAVTAVAFGALYLFATRLSYLGIFVCAVGLVFVMLLSRRLDKRMMALPLAGAVLCGAGFFVSPTYQNQLAQQRVAEEAQAEADAIIAQGEAQYGQTAEQLPEQILYPVYEQYVGEMMERFGTQRVMEAYAYTTDVTELKDWRRMKLLYNRFLQEEAGPLARLFGVEYADETFSGFNFDVENDFHGIYYLYGIVGLALFLLFLLYFVYLIARALLADFSRYMTLEAGAFGVSLCMLLAHIYCTAGVLRRPNASFYLSVVLAVVYYFVKIRSYDKDK